MKASEVLRAGKALIESTGWCQGEFSRWEQHDPDGNPIGEPCAYCVRGSFMSDHSAILDPTDKWRSTSTGYRAWEFLRKALPADYQAGDTDPVAGWNDEPGRTKEEALALMDRAAALAEAEND